AALAGLRANQLAAHPDYFISSEAVAEQFIDQIEVVFPHSTWQYEPPIVYLAPLYPTVYHDYQVTSEINYPTNYPESGLLTWPTDYYWQRRMWAFDMFFGHVPYGGAKLSNVSLGDHFNSVPPSSSPWWQNWVTLVRNTVAITKQPIVRRFLHFG